MFCEIYLLCRQKHNLLQRHTKIVQHLLRPKHEMLLLLHLHILK